MDKNKSNGASVIIGKCQKICVMIHHNQPSYVVLFHDIPDVS